MRGRGRPCVSACRPARGRPLHAAPAPRLAAPPRPPGRTHPRPARPPARLFLRPPALQATSRRWCGRGPPTWAAATRTARAATSTCVSTAPQASPAAWLPTGGTACAMRRWGAAGTGGGRAGCQRRGARGCLLCCVCAALPGPQLARPLPPWPRRQRDRQVRREHPGPALALSRARTAGPASASAAPGRAVACRAQWCALRGRAAQHGHGLLPPRSDLSSPWRCMRTQHSCPLLGWRPAMHLPAFSLRRPTRAAQACSRAVAAARAFPFHRSVDALTFFGRLRRASNVQPGQRRGPRLDS